MVGIVTKSSSEVTIIEIVEIVSYVIVHGKIILGSRIIYLISKDIISLFQKPSIFKIKISPVASPYTKILNSVFL